METIISSGGSPGVNPLLPMLLLTRHPRYFCRRDLLSSLRFGRDDDSCKVAIGEGCTDLAGLWGGFIFFSMRGGSQNSIFGIK